MTIRAILELQTVWVVLSFMCSFPKARDLYEDGSIALMSTVDRVRLLSQLLVY